MKNYKSNLFQGNKAFVFNFVFIVVLFFSFSNVHKYYVSITQIEYVEDQGALQIISRIFIDDLEDVIKERFDKSVVLDAEKESRMVDFYVESYLKESLNIKIDNKAIDINYLGKEYENDILFCYLEIGNINNIDTIEISNRVLFNKFENQKNIIRLKINKKNKTFVLTRQNQNGLLNFK